MHLDRHGLDWTTEKQSSRVLIEEKMDELGARLEHSPQESVKTPCSGDGFKDPGSWLHVSSVH
jgi:hypothetical protein